MKANLKLVESKKQDRSRPVTCDYVGIGSTGKVTHSRTPEQAIVAAVKRVLAGEWKSGIVYNQHGKPVALISKRYNNIVIDRRRGII